MKKLVFIMASLWVSLTTSLVFAQECKVRSQDEFIKKVGSIARSGDCETDSAAYRNAYEEYRGTSIKFHVIKIDGSFEIASSFPCLSGFNNDPLIIVAGPKESVTFSAMKGVCIEGKGGPVIIDRMNFRTDLKVTSNDNAVINSSFFKAKVEVSGDFNRFDSDTITQSSSNGLELKGSGNKVTKSTVEGSVRYGINISGGENAVIDLLIKNNGSGGIYLETPAIISRTVFNDNGGLPIENETVTIYPPEDLVSVESNGQWIITGNLRIDSLNVKELKIELFLQNGPYLAQTDKIDPKTGQFVFSLPKPVIADGKEILKPVFTATAIDRELGATSSFSSALDSLNQSDMDGDGIPNDQEDYNHNGLVDFGETDPRDPDTDGDGLSDGEERLHIGKIKELLDKGYKFSDLSKLSPTNADSDNDCLPDGLELGYTVIADTVPSQDGVKQSNHKTQSQDGVTQSQDIQSQDGVHTITRRSHKPQDAITRRSQTLKPQDAVSAMKLMASVASDNDSDESYFEKLSPACRAILKDQSIIIASPYDSDTVTITDPTNSDTDGDGVKDGEEDWNFDGNVGEKETNPNKPDTDGDTILDGQEGDQNKNGTLEEFETDPLLKDTDGDGITDDIEIMRYGSLPNSCDTDRDGLPDGIEAGVVNPNSEIPECSGLQIAGSNFAAIGVLSPIKSDSDGDGISDGDEDTNHNGWLDINETDPSAPDTDGDDINDYVEMKLDADRDGFPDFDISILKNGKKCSPPPDTFDLDCDGIANARDADSDGDSCPDKEEWGKDKNGDGIPDAYQQEVKSCDQSAASGAGAGGSSSASANPATSSESDAPRGGQLVFKNNEFDTTGGDCSLVVWKGAKPSLFAHISILSMLVGIYLRRLHISKPTK
ncbi:MAG: hypothetical protein COV46_04200 [Deltaproteobacteria bacterium CG11_big_fil_rev_8_21_14_0_20_49_13]|nr:MAG: hypothetical protein COV46_04200 [Deltaproteobacteria bacterium CG11_big_fil_rev_8_21_14_0_20_49_13]